jgi:hypothetical protein
MHRNRTRLSSSPTNQLIGVKHKAHNSSINIQNPKVGGGEAAAANKTTN